MDVRALNDAIDARWGDPEAFVVRLQARMVRYEISQGALARQSGFGPWHLSRWVGRNRSVQPELETMRILDEALEELIHGKGG